MAWPVCAVFMLAITGQAFAENAGKSDQIHEGNPSTSQEPELENSAKMVDFSVSEEELSEELYEEALPNLDETTIQEWEEMCIRDRSRKLPTRHRLPGLSN